MTDVDALTVSMNRLPAGLSAAMAARVIAVGIMLTRTTGRGKHLVIIDIATNQQVAQVEAGQRPWGVAIAPDGKTVFTANGPDNDVSFIDVATRTVKTKVKAGDRPWGIAYVP